MTSPLGKLLRLIRLNKNISELKASRRADLPIEKYVEFEREPEKVPMKILANIFTAIEITGEEYVDFSLLAYKLSKTKKLQTPKILAKDMDKIFKYPKNVLKFTDKRGIRKPIRSNKNFRKKDPSKE